MFHLDLIKLLPQVLYLHFAGKGMDDFHLLIVLWSHSKHLVAERREKLDFKKISQLEDFCSWRRNHENINLMSVHTHQKSDLAGEQKQLQHPRELRTPTCFLKK